MRMKIRIWILTNFAPHRAGDGVVGKQRSQPQEQRALCLRAPQPVWPMLGTGNAQREETLEDVLENCTLCFYISKTQISTILHICLSNYMMKKSESRYDLCSNGFCIISMQHGLDSPTFSLFTSMFWSSNKQTHKNLEVKRNPYLLMLVEEHFGI